MTILIRKEMRLHSLALLMSYGEGRRRCSTRLSQRLGSDAYSRYEVSPLQSDSELLICFQVPLIALQAAMPIKDMATSTSTFGFLRCAQLECLSDLHG